jgi:hypothetical protein
MTHPLDDSRLKMDRAVEHANTLGKEISAWITRQGTTPPYRIEFNQYDTYLSFYIDSVDDFPKAWSLIAGDAFSNFRSALDFSAWQMVKAGSDPNPKREYEVSFPIQTDETKFPKSVKSHLPGVRPDHLAIVKKHQPYTFGKDTVRHPLAILAHLSRIDKHRRIALVLARNLQYSARVKRAVGWNIDRISGPGEPGRMVKTGTELFRLYGTPTHVPNIEVNVDFEGALTIAFEDGSIVMDTLSMMSSAVKIILDELTPLF